MKTKALLLSALILAPTAGAAAAQVESDSAFQVQTGKTPATPAQDFRVSYANAAVGTIPTIFTKSNLPQALSDEELDEVTGEGGAGAAAGAVVGGVGGGVTALIGEAYEAAANYIGTGSTGKTWGQVGTQVGKGIAGGMAGGAFVGFFFPGL